jgi:hypothetical protein
VDLTGWYKVSMINVLQVIICILFGCGDTPGSLISMSLKFTQVKPHRWVIAQLLLVLDWYEDIVQWQLLWSYELDDEIDM